MNAFRLFQKHSLPMPGGAYSLGLILVVLTLALRVFLLPGFQIPILVIFVPAILATSTLGGFRAGLFATVFACVSADYVLIPPFFSLTIPSENVATDLVSLAVTGLVTAAVCAVLRRAIQQSEAAKAELASALRAADRLAQEQRKTELALRDSLERLEKVLDNQTVGATFWDMNTGAMIDANKTFLDLMGYDRSDLEERRLFWQNLTPPEYLEVSRAEVEKFLATGRVGPYEKEYFCKDGSRKWLLFAGSSLGGNQCVEFCVDISARKKAEAALRESEEKFRSLIDQASDAFFLHDENGRFLEVNRQACDSLGYARDELLRMSVFDVQVDLDRAGAQREAAEPGDPRTIEGCYRRKDGTEFPVETRLCAYHLGGQKLQLALVRDVSERKRASEALRTQANLLMQSFDAIIVWRLDGVIEWWNTGAEYLYGYSANEAVGKETHSLLSTTFPKPWPEIRAELIENGSWEGELQHRTRDGDVVTVSARKQLVRDSHGIERVLETNRDITEKKRSEVSLRQYEEHLRTMRDQLAHVGRVSELAQVSAGIAHELNQPLAAMMNYSNVAKRLIATKDVAHLERAQDAVAKAADQAERAGLIIRRMRGFIEKRNTRRTLENINIVVEEAVALGLLGTQGDGITTDVQLGDGLPLVYVDRVQIQQVVVNLMRNAIEAMAQSPRREITLATTLNAENEVVISVGDTGPGLSKEAADRIFMPFFTTKQGGMGIGLVISQSILEAHGGRLTVDSSPGCGALFQCRLPAADSIASDLGQAAG
jgi:two-component system sensor kinase FixL